MTTEPNAEAKPVNHSRRLAARSGKRRVLLAVLFMALAVGAGIAIGAGGSVLYFKHKRFSPPQPEQFAKDTVHHMEKAVTLTPDESARLEAMILARMQAVKGLRREMFGRIREEFNALADDVDAILGPERAAAWDKAFHDRTGRSRRPPPRDRDE